jgi:hypothetical protein
MRRVCEAEWHLHRSTFRAVPDTAFAAAERTIFYLSGWNLWNHFRGAASLAATALLMVALYRSRLLDRHGNCSD